MSFDGVFTHTIVNELKTELLSGRIAKIHQPYEHEIVLVIRARGENKRLLLSAHPSYARMQLTKIAYHNPENPPNFVMMLRKYLEGAILETIHQVENDRVVHFTFSKRNELGDLQNIVLIVELMGRHSTIVLLNAETNKILDAIKHIGSSQNTYRSILPGVDYIAPPKQTQLNPFTASKTEVFEILATAEKLDARYLQQHFQGLGRDTAEELRFRLAQAPNEKIKVWQAFWQQVTQQPTPTIGEKGQKEFFAPIEFETFTKAQHFPNLSLMLDAFYGEKAEKDRVKQLGNQLIRKVENEIKRNQTKLEKRQQTLKDSENAEEYRRRGELLTTFMAQVPRGAESVELENYYEENQPLKITLNPALSPSQNAQKYFHKYQKLKNAVKLIYTQIKSAKEEIAYLQSILAQLELAGPMDIEVIREELIASGYLKKKRSKKRNSKPSKPEEFTASDGTLILVGKNNLQNDQLTLKTAKKTDIWLHAKNIPGSHVIIKDTDPSETTLLEAAELAAYFSKYRQSAQVPVDYVAVKNVHKPNGAKPGFVIYENQKTLFVTPEEKTIQQLRENHKK
ncbi:fibronectin-binding protein EfbA [Enterococcus sp. CSURQ0835]|uniref:fibronectin-binding protein EfbA n=1 Tax=Enterococcus sp. CSURQ0835 TaxID=2681394 RepID=UPI001356C6C5|nr:fibronectin-binding protein EfbA [Enterococcus sp. CSURQ0835]